MTSRFFCMMNSISFRQVKMASVFFLIAGCGIAGEKWEESAVIVPGACLAPRQPAASATLAAGWRERASFRC